MGVNVPAGQLAQEGVPATAVYEPLAHSAQEATDNAPNVEEYMPAAQGLQVAEATGPLNDPGGQARQAVAP